MKPFIVIKQYDHSNAIEYKNLIQYYVMSFAFNTFLSCIFKEVLLCLSHNVEKSALILTRCYV